MYVTQQQGPYTSHNLLNECFVEWLWIIATCFPSAQQHTTNQKLASEARSQKSQRIWCHSEVKALVDSCPSASYFNPGAFPEVHFL